MENTVLEMVKNDIELCEQSQNQAAGSQDVYEMLIARYTTFYPKFKDEIPASGKAAPLGMPFDYRREIRTIKAKLETLLAAGYRFEIPVNEKKVPLVKIDNRNENTLTVNITFDMVRQQIEDMSALSKTQIDEVLEKIKELEDIVNSDDKKPAKWERAKKILLWVADKGVDVGIAMLPLLLKI